MPWACLGRALGQIAGVPRKEPWAAISIQTVPVAQVIDNIAAAVAVELPRRLQRCGFLGGATHSA
jgi:hypothetical protein